MTQPEFQYVGGFHTIMALLEAMPETIMAIFLEASREDQRTKRLLDLAKKQKVEVHRCSLKELETESPKFNFQNQGIVVQCRSFPDLNESFLDKLITTPTKPLLLLVLDGVQDPHNLGACLRTANGFGVDAVIAPRDRACGLTPVVFKVACGAANLTPFVRVTNLSRTLKAIKEKGVWIVGLLSQGEAALSEIDLTGHIAIVLGNEGQGIRRLTQQCCDYTANISMSDSSRVDSFNVSAATAIALYEAVRQRSE